MALRNLNHQKFDYRDKTIWRKDRKLHSDGVLIAENGSIPAEPVDNTDVIIVSINKSVLLKSYYCPSMHVNNANLTELLK